MITLKANLFLFLTALAVLMASASFAQPAQEDLTEAVEIKQEEKIVPLFDEPTHPAIKLSPDKSKLIRMDKVVAKVIVGNPTHLAVLPSDKNTIVLVGRTPGATSFTALDDKGNIVMQRQVLVAPPQNDYVRIRRTCAASEQDNCQETKVFYCPDTCHNVALPTEPADDEASDGPTSAGGEGGETAPPALPNEIDSASD